MATRKKAVTSEQVLPAELLISRDEAKSRLQERIQKGLELKNAQISARETLDVAKNDYQKWDSFNAELLRRIFSTEALEEWEVRAAPVIGQRHLPKSLDIRVTVVGERAFSAAIHSQNDAETKVDWRSGSDPNIQHSIHKLPRNIELLCLALVKKLNLRFGAIDLVLDDQGKYWFLEINPNGQWAWIENRTGLPIAEALVDEIERIGAALS